MGNITIKILAKELNLSVATISKAFKDSHEISQKTKQVVLEAAKRLNYIPNPYASSLRKKESKTIAVVVPEVADSFFSLAINGIETVAQEKGYHVLVYLTHENYAREQAILKDFQSGRVDGILMSVSRETTATDHISDVMARGIPVVFFDRACEDVETAKITTDDFNSGYNATAHLAEQGCQRIAYLSISKTLSISQLRMEGYKKALAGYDMAVKEKNIVFCTDDAADNYALVKKLMKRSDRPDGIIASVEKLTTSIYLACKDVNVSIPKDVKVVSFSNLQSASILNPSLTTVTQPAFEMGVSATTVLMKALKKAGFNLTGEQLVLPSALIKRDSTLK